MGETMTNSPGAPLSILLIDDDEQILNLMHLTLRASGHENVHTFRDSRSAIDHISLNGCDVVVLDILMIGMSGIDVLKRIKEIDPDSCVIMATGVNEVATAVECMKASAFDYIVKPLEPQRLLASIGSALKVRSIKREYEALSESMLADSLKNPEIFTSIITRNEKMFTIFRYIEAIAPTSHPVLITGETGTGKDLIAQAVHRSSGLRGKFVAVNVAGLDDAMFSDTLFGHTKGAFTGADCVRQGLIESAAGGTLFLDEIGDLSAQSQVKLLRLVQQREFYPMGCDTPRTCSARVVTATCQDIGRLHSEGRMRHDLFYRLRTHHIHLPSLRERKDDLEPLVSTFIDAASRDQHKPRPAVPHELVTLLSTWRFPGNIRELEGMVRNAISLHHNHILSMKSFREHIGAVSEVVSNGSQTDRSAGEIVFPEKLPTLEEINKLLVDEALARSHGNQSIAADLLGITRQALGYRLKKAPFITVQVTGNEPLIVR
jgi:DNA-binding NtrC family response regulator